MKLRIEQLEAVAPRDKHDTALRRQLAVSTERHLFKTSELPKHAAKDAPLRSALVAADITTVEDLGLWLRDHKGIKDGILIERRGRLWRVTYTSDT